MYPTSLKPPYTLIILTLLCVSGLTTMAEANHLAPADHQHGEVSKTDSEGVRIALLALLVGTFMVLPVLYFLLNHTRLADR